MLSRFRSAAPHLPSAFSSRANSFVRNTPTEITYYYLLGANAFSSKVATASADSPPSTQQISNNPEVVLFVASFVVDFIKSDMKLAFISVDNLISYSTN